MAACTGMISRRLASISKRARQQRAINTNKGWGNFHLLPNGVFYIQPGHAGILESKAFLASGIKPFYATQSGPMLVIDGKLHPSFLADSTSLKTRNGVGVSADGKVIFALSDGAVRFHDFGDPVSRRSRLHQRALPRWQHLQPRYTGMAEAGWAIPCSARLSP